MGRVKFRLGGECSNPTELGCSEAPRGAGGRWQTGRWKRRPPGAHGRGRGCDSGLPRMAPGSQVGGQGLTLSPSDRRWGRGCGTLGLEEEDRAKGNLCDVPQGEDRSPRAHPRLGAKNHNLSPAFGLGTSPGTGHGTQGLELVQSLLGHTTRLTEAMEIPVTARWLAGSSYPHTDKTFSPQTAPLPPQDKQDARLSWCG